jgi:hypothetical protein
MWAREGITMSIATTARSNQRTSRRRAKPFVRPPVPTDTFSRQLYHDYREQIGQLSWAMLVGMRDYFLSRPDLPGEVRHVLRWRNSRDQCDQDNLVPALAMAQLCLTREMIEDNLKLAAQARRSANGVSPGVDQQRFLGLAEEYARRAHLARQLPTMLIPAPTLRDRTQLRALDPAALEAERMDLLGRLAAMSLPPAKMLEIQTNRRWRYINLKVPAGPWELLDEHRRAHEWIRQIVNKPNRRRPIKSTSGSVAHLPVPAVTGEPQPVSRADAAQSSARKAALRAVHLRLIADVERLRDDRRFESILPENERRQYDDVSGWGNGKLEDAAAHLKERYDLYDLILKLRRLPEYQELDAPKLKEILDGEISNRTTGELRWALDVLSQLIN